MKPDSAGTFLKMLRVRKLFGHLDYDLNLSPKDRTYDNRLAILYGDNGSGKTTILNLLYHLMSPVDDRGHKSVLVRTKFSLFEVTLCDGTRIAAERSGGTTGDMVLKIERGGSVLHEVTLKVNDKGAVSVTSGTPEEANVKSFLQALSQISLELLFMRDNRWLTSSLDDSHAERFDSPQYLSTEGGTVRFGHVGGMLSAAALVDGMLSQGIENVNSYFRHQTMVATSRGELDTNNIYQEIIKHLLRPGGTQRARGALQFTDYMVKLGSLLERNRSFVRLGLTRPLLSVEILTSLQQAKPASRRGLLNIVQPYIDSVQARLDALEPIQRQMIQFLDALNSFLGPSKSIKFHMRRGLLISGYEGEALNPQCLSSGEKQLLTIFCHITCARERTAIFIIDEPEISLNVKWQRKLIQSLLDCTQARAIQFLMATHSVELLTRHREHVLPLNDLSKGSQHVISAEKNT